MDTQNQTFVLRINLERVFHFVFFFCFGKVLKGFDEEPSLKLQNGQVACKSRQVFKMGRPLTKIN
jgi:hypothetical protein